jgi:hypothetical protein
MFVHLHLVTSDFYNICANVGLDSVLVLIVHLILNILLVSDSFIIIVIFSGASAKCK